MGALHIKLIEIEVKIIKIQGKFRKNTKNKTKKASNNELKTKSLYA